MNKKDKQVIMNALAESHTPEKVVLHIIKSLADQQEFKQHNVYNKFCVDCAIYYTGNMFVMMGLIKAGIDTVVWSDEFIAIVEGFKQ
jgi:hypothetical protein